jgi:hypothetical protein
MKTANATRIPARHPVREAFAGRSTGCKVGPERGSDRIGYYETKGEGLEAFSDALHDHAFCFDQEVYSELDGNEGHKEMRVLDGNDNHVGYARISWHRMESGRYEFTGYIA